MEDQHADNVTFDETPVRFSLSSPLVAVMDPLALDALSEELPGNAARLESNAREFFEYLSGINIWRGAIALYEVPDFQPGVYEFDSRDLVLCGGDESGPLDTFDVDSGSAILVDCRHVGRLARLLNWDIYEAAVASPVGDDRIYRNIARELGGAFYALVFAPGVWHPFGGDGTYGVRPGAIRFVGSEVH